MPRMPICTFGRGLSNIQPTDSTCWRDADKAIISHFHPKSCEHRPRAVARGLYDMENLYVRFDVKDRYVRCVQTEYQSLVSKDTCVEFFAQPRPDKGYFNFEMNCGGSLLLFYIEDSAKPETGPGYFKKYTVIPPEIGSTVKIEHSLPRVVDPEIADPIDWWLIATIPFALMEHYVGSVNRSAGAVWRGNFFKAAPESSHPHWASWSDIGQVLRFHQPDRFGELRFA